MKNNKNKRIIVIFLIIALVILLIVTIKNNGILTKKQNQQLANVGYTTQIGDKQYNITDKIENDIVPTISAGMIPIKQDGEYWTIVDRTDNTWCNYANGQPAYMMLNDGEYQSEEYYQMPDTKKVAKSGAQISKDSIDLGSIYMWIPRFAYNENGDIIYIKQEATVAGTWTMPDVFTYETEKEDYALAGIWVECKETEETELATKIEEMNTQNSKYGFIANTKVAQMTEDDKNAMQKFLDNVNKILGNDCIITKNINTKKYSIIHIVNTNIVEPIQGLGDLDNENERIEITVKHCTYFPVVKVINGKGIELEQENEKYIQLLDDIVLPYVIIDSKGNMKEINFENLFLISNADELSRFRDEVNSGKNFEGITVIQVADIDLSSVCGEKVDTDDDGVADSKISWIPIGATENEKHNWSTLAKITKDNVCFNGIYDGRYHTISDLYIDTDTQPQVGLFGIIFQDAVVKNLILDNININCTYNGSDANNFVGGISGVNFGTIKHCGIDNGKISCTVQNNYNKSSALGGMAGYFIIGKISECYNKAEIFNQNPYYTYLGGIVGHIGNGHDTEISSCYNVGNLSADKTNIKTGGILGNTEDQGKNNIITKCYNIGDLGTKGTKGGIIGCIYNNASYFQREKNYCVDSATYNATLVDSQDLKEYVTEDYLGDAFIKDDKYGINGGYPILKWQLNVPIYVDKICLDENSDMISVKILYNKYNINNVADKENTVLFHKEEENKLYTLELRDINGIIIKDEKGNFRKSNKSYKIIKNADDLCEFRDEVNAGNTFKDVDIIQVADIDLSSKCGLSVNGEENNTVSWNPIGADNTKKYLFSSKSELANNSTGFNGTYDGRYHTISSLYIDTDEFSYVGLFGKISQNGIVQKVVLDDVYINCTYNGNDANNFVGGISGINLGTIKNCGIENGDIKCIVSKNYSKSDALGGITGWMLSGKIKECYNKSKLYSENPYGSHEGGIVGNTYNSNGIEISNCYNTGIINAQKGTIRIGGIIGYMDTSYYINVIKCYNIGEFALTGTKGGIIASINGGSNITRDKVYCISNATNSAIYVDSEELKTYATEDKLGDAFEDDKYMINDGYPILKWQNGKTQINAKVYIENNDIIVEIISGNNIIEVVNEFGTPLNTVVKSKKYSESLSDGEHKYTIKDENGNVKILNLKKINVINDLSDLSTFRNNVNSGNRYLGEIVYQTADIDTTVNRKLDTNRDKFKPIYGNIYS